MDLREYLGVLQRQLILILSCTTLSLAAATAYVITRTPEYTSHAQLFISTGDHDVGAGGEAFSEQRIRSYVQVMESPAVARAVIDQLDLPYENERARAAIRASIPLDTVLIDYSVTDPSPTRAREMAEAFGSQFESFVQELESPQGRQGRSSVTVSVTKPATLPTEPSSPRPVRVMALGLVAGLGLGVVAATVRESLDRTVRTKALVTRTTNAPVLGQIPAVRQKPEGEGILGERDSSPAADAFRRLSTAIRSVAGQGASSLVITSPTTIAEKSGTTANLAVALAEVGNRVLLIDADIRQASLTRSLDLEPSPGLVEVLNGELAAEDAWRPWSDALPLSVLPSGASSAGWASLLGSDNMAELLKELAESWDVVVLDTPPLLTGAEAAILAPLVRGTVVLVRCGSTTREELTAAVDAVASAGGNLLGVVLSGIPATGRAVESRFDRPPSDTDPAH